MPVEAENIDTDQIIPARFLKATERKGFGDNLFRDWRYDAEGRPIAAFPLILLEKKASSRTYLEKYFLQSGVRLTPEIELGARSLLVDLAKIGFGVAGVTREFVQGELAAGEIRELSTAFSIPPRTVDLCMLRNVSPSAATERFARDVLEKLQGKSVSV